MQVLRHMLKRFSGIRVPDLILMKEMTPLDGIPQKTTELLLRFLLLRMPRAMLPQHRAAQMMPIAEQQIRKPQQIAKSMHSSLGQTKRFHT